MGYQMLHVEVRKTMADGSVAVITPENRAEIPGLCDMLSQSFIIENPAKTFARMYKAGCFDGMTECETAYIAEFANIISDAWLSDLRDKDSGQPEMNIIRVMVRLMQMCYERTLFQETDNNML